MQRMLRYLRLAVVAVVAGATLFAVASTAQANFISDNADFSSAFSALRSAIGDHPRVLRIEVDQNGVEIEAQDPHNRSHVDLWRYGTSVYFSLIPVKRLSGPQPVNPQLINPDLEANLFELDSIDLSAAPKLIGAAIARAQLQDAAAVTHIEVVRQTFILPKPTSGDVRWTLRVDSGRERAEIYANTQGVIIGADVSDTQRAKNLDLLKETTLAADAVAEFRSLVGAGPVLTAVGVTLKTVSFATNIPDRRLGISSLPTVASFTWDLNGLQQRLGNIDISAQIPTSEPSPFSVDDVNWTILAKLEQDALAKAAVPRASVTRLSVGKSSEQPGNPTIVWTVEITEPSGEVTSVIADAKGVIERVVFPPSRRPKVKWLDAATIARAIARAVSTFGREAKIASIVFEDNGGRITIDDAANGGRAATFDFSGDGVTRSPISFSLDSMGPRLSVTDLAALTEQRFVTIEADAMKRLGGGRVVYLESVSIGAHPFVEKAGAHAIEVRIRDIEVDSVHAHYGWIVYDFNGRVLDFSTL